MEALTIEQWVEKSDYLRGLQEQVLFITQGMDDYYKASPKISVKSGTKQREISSPLLQTLVTDDKYYEYVRKLFADEISEFSTRWIFNGDVTGGVRLTKTEIVNGLREAINSGKIILGEDANNRFNTISNEISFERLREKIKGNNYNIIIDGREVSIPIDLMFQFLQLPPKQYEEFFDLAKKPSIGELPKEYFTYAILKYFKENETLFDHYIVPEVIIDRYNDLMQLQKIDMEALNKITTIEDDNVAKTVIDAGLKSAILNDMPQDASKLEKAIYIYIKMCKTLTYDDEFYAVNQRGAVVEKHENIENITKITVKNNKVVCYEFNAIYAKLLEELGIKFEIDSDFIDGFGGGHANLSFRSDKFLIDADSVTSILQGDLVHAKLNQPLVGLKCTNKNENTKKEFSQAISKMYGLITRKELVESTELPAMNQLDSFIDLLAKYQKMTPQNTFPLTLDEKLEMLMEKVNRAKFTGIDAISYIIQLRNVIFNEDERYNNICIAIVRNNKPNDKNKIAMSSVVFTVNYTNMNKNPDQNIYYFYNSLGDLTPISRNQLEYRFKSELLQYIENNNLEIPGIMAEKGIKNDR